ncbi:MAG: hypothetical protein Q9190_001954, partial [Brigantiaea leucoxantha]
MARRVTRVKMANDGTVSSANKEKPVTQSLSNSPPSTGRAGSKKAAASKASNTAPRSKTLARKSTEKKKDADTSTKATKRKREVAPKQEDSKDMAAPALKKPKAKQPSTKKESTHKSEDAHDPLPAASIIDAPDNSPPTKQSRKKKTNPYGLTPGISPYPNWPHPTAQECEEVNSLLSSLHGTIKPPETIPNASRTVAGCGEVPCVLDALIRTYLSAATAGRNSNRSFQGLLEEFKEQKTGMGKGSVNWDEVRKSDVSRCFEAIKSGGLAVVKSRNIKRILDMVHEENVEARRTEASEKSGTKEEEEEEKEEGPPLTLDHLHSLPTDVAFAHLLRYPGVGVKTASCVTMFCLRRPSFAVDTHVFRLAKWLGWVPPHATRDTTFMHCEVRVPEEL